MTEVFEFIGGLILLIVGGELIVRGGVSIANRFKVPSLVIGMTVIALGTSLPELLVSMQSALSGHPEIALGNVIGSNICNIGLILGLTALVLPISVTKDSVKRDLPFLLFVSLVFILSMLDSNVGRLDGFALVALLVFFVFYSILKAKKNTGSENEEEGLQVSWPLPMAILVIVVAGVALGYGSDLLVDGASEIARDLNISERVIAITMVALGTSLPELTTSMIAAIRKESDIALGNVIGSNIINILLVIGASSLVHPIETFEFDSFRNDLIWMIVFTVLLWLCISPLRQRIRKRPANGENYAKLGRLGGGLILATYIGYIVYIFVL
ncbi:MAG: calcium/sodium antiporter [Paludibacteraceae bacterium]|nr:calcium/sodium antiporter [Paludibacteraceae bacterium]